MESVPILSFKGTCCTLQNFQSPGGWKVGSGIGEGKTCSHTQTRVFPEGGVLRLQLLVRPRHKALVSSGKDSGSKRAGLRWILLTSDSISHCHLINLLRDRTRNKIGQDRFHEGVVTIPRGSVSRLRKS